MSPEHKQEYDVVIAGSGPMGAVTAAVCVRAGLRVVMLESGDHPPKNRYAMMERAMREEIAWKFEPWRYETHGEDLQLNTFAIRKVGGSSVAWGAVTPRFLVNDFRLASEYGVAVDWPISYEDLEKDYGKAEWFMGVSGAADDSFNGPRSSPYPMPAFPMGKTDLYVKNACDRLGIEVHSVPSARNSVTFQGRSRCVNYAICRACPNGALYSSDYTVRELMRNPNFRLITGAHVAKVLLGDAGKAEALIYHTEDGRQHRIAGGRFVLATQAVENTRILLNSKTDACPNGVANSSRSLGSYLTEHMKFYYQGEVPDKLDPHLRGYETATTLQFHDHGERGEYAGGRILIRENGGPSPAHIASESGYWGDALRREVEKIFGRFVTLGAFMEQLPYAENRVSLSSSQTDKFGLPVARIDFKLMKDYEKRGFKVMSKTIKRIYREMNARNVRLVLEPSVSGHYMGCHRMGVNPATSVTDSKLRCHDVENLYLASIGAFPTGGISNPTLTGVALAIRMAESIVGNGNREAVVLAS